VTPAGEQTSWRLGSLVRWGYDLVLHDQLADRVQGCHRGTLGLTSLLTRVHVLSSFRSDSQMLELAQSKTGRDTHGSEYLCGG